MTPLCSITCTDKDHVKPSVLGPSAASLVMGSRYYGPDNIQGEATNAKYYMKHTVTIVKPSVKNATPNRC